MRVKIILCYFLSGVTEWIEIKNIRFALFEFAFPIANPINVGPIGFTIANPNIGIATALKKSGNDISFGIIVSSITYLVP